MRIEVTLPNRLPHNFCPAASDTYAFGVALCASQ
jgi:hypothetical protein